MDNYKDYATAAIVEQLSQEVNIKFSHCERLEKFGEALFVIAGRVNGAGNLVAVFGENCELVISEFVEKVKLEAEAQKKGTL